MRRRGWFRVWVVASAVFVPAVAIWAHLDNEATWKTINEPLIQICIDNELNLSSHPDGMKCMHDAGVDRTIYEDEKTTPRTYWAELLLFSLLFDLVLTALIVGVFLVARWVVRGFRDEDSERA